MTKRYIDPEPQSGKVFYDDFHDKGAVIMLNLLKFREIADYTGLGEIKPQKEISGEEAYDHYLENTIPLLQTKGSRIIYYGRSHSFLVGPEAQKWDAILLVEHKSVSKLIEFAQNKDYLKKAGHRMAALEDSRVLPSTEIKIRS